MQLSIRKTALQTMPLKLEDKIELLELAGRYGDAVDDRDWPAMASIFTEDAVFLVPSLNAKMDGLAAIQHYMEEAGKLHPAAHLMTNIYSYEKDGEVHLRFRGILPMNRVAQDGSAAVLHGSYYDKVVKTEAGWRVKHRVFSRQRL